MSVDVMAWVWKHSLAKGTDRLVLLAIADHARLDGTEAWPSVATLASKCAVNARTISSCIRRLVDLGELQVWAHAGGPANGPFYSPRHRPNLYRVLMPERRPEPLEGVDRPCALPPCDALCDSPCDNWADPLQPRSVTPPPTTSVTPPPTTGHIREPSEGQRPLELTALESKPSPPSGGIRFDAFWGAYPKRNGKRVGRRLAEAKWRSMTPEAQQQAMTGAGHYRSACEQDLTIAKDAERWLRHRCWEDWQEPAVADLRRRPGSRRETTTSAGLALLRSRGVLG